MLANDTMYRRIISIFKIDASEGLFDSRHCFHFFNVCPKSVGIADAVKCAILDVIKNIVAVIVRVRKLVIVDDLVHERVILISVLTERKIILKQTRFVPFVQHLVGFLVIANGCITLGQIGVKSNVYARDSFLVSLIGQIQDLHGGFVGEYSGFHIRELHVHDSPCHALTVIFENLLAPIIFLFITINL